MNREDKLKYSDICYIRMVDSFDLINNEFDEAYPMSHWTTKIRTILNDLGIDNDYYLCRALFDINMKEHKRFCRQELCRQPFTYKIDINLRDTV